MRKTTLILIFNLSLLLSVNGQEIVVKPDFLKCEMDEMTKENILKSLDSLFNQINQGKLNAEYLTSNRTDLTTSALEVFQSYEKNKDSIQVNIRDKQLINFYPISNNKYLLTVAYIVPKTEKNHQPTLLHLLNLVAENKNEKTTFSIPIDYLTSHWETTKIGNITYHHRNKLNQDRAIDFNQKNTEIAEKLGVKPENLDFYICDNYQEIVKLLGIEYSTLFNGKYRDGYGVDSGTIFSIMGNEDFSHDMFHYYSGKINKRENRNWITEEGLAYLFGNAYYTDRNGEMITYKRLVNELKKYLYDNPKTDLFKLFEDNQKIFNHIAPEISVRSTISGVIANEVMKEKGKNGMMKLINCGRKDRMYNFLKMTNELIGLNKSNFNSEVKKLIENH